MNILNSLQTAMNSIAQFLPKVIGFLVILLIGWIVARVLRKVVTKLLAKVGLDRVAERGGLRQFTGNYTMSELTGTLVYAAIMLFTLQFGFNVFGPNPVSVLINDLVGWLPQLFVAGVIMVVAFAIANTVFNLVSGAMASTSYGRGLGRAAQGAIIAIAGIAALNQVGIATTVTTPILITVLAMIGGVVVVGVGGGLIGPMRSRWERMLGAAENEAGNLRTQMSNRQSQSSSEFGQQSYTSQQYSQEGADVQQEQYREQRHPQHAAATQQQYQQQSTTGQQYYQPPVDPTPPHSA